MGFTKYEKTQLKNSLRSDEVTSLLIEKTLPSDVIEFLKSQKLLKQVRDYCIIPRIQKPGRPESLVVTYFLDYKTQIFLG